VIGQLRRRRLSGVALLLLACVAASLCAAAEMRILARALVLSWDLPATQAADELSVQASLYTDPSTEARRAVEPVPDRGRPHAVHTPLERSRPAATACLTRSPPSA
jgi:hypothetical protein